MNLNFMIVGRSYLWSLYLGMLGKGLSKTFEKLVKSRQVDHFEKCDLFPDLQFGFRSSRSTAALLTVVPDKIAETFNRLGATRAEALDISEASDKVWHTGLLHKLRGDTHITSTF